MKTAQSLKEQIALLLDEAESLNNVAKAEDRELTAAEQQRFSAIMDADSGEVTQARNELEHAEKLETEQSRLSSLRAESLKPASHPLNVELTGDAQADELPLSSRINVPVKNQFRHSKLHAYRGDHGERKAYIAGQFLLATVGKNPSAAAWCADNGLDVRFHGALSTSDNTLGGYLVPDEMEQAIIDLKEEYGVFRSAANLVPMASDTKTQPRRVSGVTAYFSGDNEALTESDANWDNVQLVAKKLHCLSLYSTEMSEDSVVSIGDVLTREIAYAFSNKEDECGFNGDGTSTYGGIVGVLNAVAAGSIYTAATGNTAFSTLDLADFEGMVGQLPAYAEGNAAWYVSKAGYWASMARLLDAAGGNTIQDLGSGPERVFLGYPVRYTQVLNSTLTAQTSTNILCFGDLSMSAMLGNRRGISVMTSEHRYFENDQIGIKGTQRFDINVHERGTASVAGSILVLATPGS